MHFRRPFALLAAFVALTQTLPAVQPNIIFILVDDLGYGDLGSFYQNSRNFAANRNKPAFVTPKLDQMAAEGASLTRHYCGAPVCAPSRASLMLGVTQGHANLRDNQFDKALENNHTVASVMRGAGYATALIGKWGMQGSGTVTQQPGHPLLRGFDYFYGYMAHLTGHFHYPERFGAATDDQGQPLAVFENYQNITTQLTKCYSTDLFTARAKKWIVDQNTAHAEQPFFLYLAYPAPHARLEVPTQAYPAGNGVSGGLQWLGSSGNMINTANGAIDSFIYPDYANATYDNDNNSGTAEVAWPDTAKRHATMIRRLDDSVADLIQTLKDLGIDDNTLVVFTSDNGPHNEPGMGGSYTQDPRFFGSYGNFDGIKRDTLEGGLRVPAIVRWPGTGHIPAGVTRTDPSQFQDWMATFADLAGVAAPARCDGVSLLPTLIGTGSRTASTIYTEYNRPGESTPSYSDFLPAHRGQLRNQEQVLWIGNYKGIRYNIAGDNSTPFKIYDVATDTHEGTDLNGQPGIPSQAAFQAGVLQARRPNSSAGRPAYDNLLVPSVVADPVQPGVTWKAFEKAFLWVPGFGAATPAASGTTPVPSVSVRTRNNDIGLEFTGYLNVPADGDYTFYLSADTGAFLRLHQAQLLDADFGYTGGSERSATIKLKAGLHPFTLGYRRGSTGSPAMALSWSGPSLAKQAIPASSFFVDGLPATPPPARWKIEEGSGTTTSEEASATVSDAFGTGVIWSTNTPGPDSVASLVFPGTAAGNFGTNRSAADLGINGSGAKTITGWIKTSASSSQMFFGWTPGNGGQAGQDLRLGLDASGHLRFEVSSGFALAGTTALNDGQWHMVGVVIEPGDRTPTVQFYIDGILSAPTSSGDQAIATAATGLAPREEVVLGTGYPTGTQQNWNGSLDDVRVFPEALAKPALDALRNAMIAAPPEPSPVRWPLEEGSGTTTTESSLSIVSDPFGAGVTWSAVVPGPASSASLSFANGSGVGTNLDATSAGISGSGAKTITAWIKTATTAEDGIVGYSPTNGGTAGADLRLLVNAGGKLRLEANAGNFALSANSVNDNAWHFVALVIPAGASTGGVSFYTDGVLSAPASSGGSTVLNTVTVGGKEILLGSDGNSGRDFSGLLDDVRIYKKALSKSELDALMAAMAVAPPVSGYAGWINGFFPGETDLAIIGLDADPDHDGSPNALEMLLGTNPTLGGDAAAPTSDVVGNDFIYSFDRADAAIGALAVTLQVSDDLLSWPPANDIVIGEKSVDSGTGVTINDQGANDQVEIAIPTTGFPKRFVRLRLALP